MTTDGKLADFQVRRHAADSAYGSAAYDLRALMRLPSMRRWTADVRGRGARVLDVGTGKGVLLRDLCGALAARGVTPLTADGVDLVDPGPAGAFAGADGFRFHAHDVEAGPLPFPPGRFDFVLCHHVLEHVFATERLVRELRRLVRPDGRVLIGVPNLAAWPNRLLLLAGIQPLGTELGEEAITYGWPWARARRRLAAYRPVGHIRAFTPRGLRDLCTAAGFRVGGWWNTDESRWLRLTRFAGRKIALLLEPAPVDGADGPGSACAS